MSVSLHDREHVPPVTIAALDAAPQAATLHVAPAPEDDGARDPTRALRLIRIACGALLASLALAVLAGWASGNPTFTSVIPGFASMKANTALAFLLGAVALLAPGVRFVAELAATLVVAIAAATLAQDVTGFDLGIDERLFRDAGSDAPHPGRMSPATAVAFVLGGCAMMLSIARGAANAWASQILAAACAAIGTMALLGYAYDVSALYTVPGFTSIALHTAAAIVVLALGIFASRGDGLMALFLSAGPGGRMARRVIPFAFALFGVFGWVASVGVQAGWYGAELGLGVFAVLVIFSFAALTWHQAVRIDAAERASRAADAALRQSEARFRQLAENVEDVFWIMEWPGRRVVYASPAFERTWGLDRAELYRDSGSWTRRIEEEDRARVADALVRDAEAGRYDVEYRIALPGGPRRWIHDRCFPLRDARGRVWRLVGIARDVTLAKRARESIAESELRLRLAQRAAGLGIHDYDVQTGEIRWDDRVRQLWGLSPGEPVTYATFIDGVHPDDREAVRAAVDRALDPEGGGHYVGLYRVVGRADGRVRWIEATGQVGFDAGRAVRMVGTVQDVTARVDAEAELRDADRRKDHFIAVLAHELRNPLAPIRTGLEILRRAGDNRALAERTRAAMDRQVTHMVRLIDDLTDVARIKQGTLALRLEPADVREAVHAALEASRPLLDAAGHSLCVSLPPEPLPVQGDPLRLAQVFANLVNNAARYTPRGGSVAIDARREGARAVVAVVDDGVGIPASMLGRIFEPFTQVSPHDGGAQQGLGVGLSLARTIVGLHGGAIEARSEGEGRGSAFVVTLPLAVDS